MHPIVSVILPVYNGSKYLRQSIDSILCQSLQNFELIILNDGSTDDSKKIIDEYRDSRIIKVEHANMGLAKTLNVGLEQARGKYIARQDQDDISFPKRLEMQVSYLENKSSLILCGGSAKIIGGGKHKQWNYPQEPGVIHCELLFSNVFAHSSVVFRKESLDRASLRYSNDYPYAEDYEMWVRCSNGHNIANLNDLLLEYRISPSSSSRKNVSIQESSIKRIQESILKRMCISPTNEEWLIHRRIEYPGNINSLAELKSFEQWLLKLKKSNDVNGIFQEETFNHVLAERWWYVCRYATSMGLNTWYCFYRSALLMTSSPSISKRMKLLLHTLLTNTHK